ncbi:hypothetical protein SB781_36100, partial [Paraburkholderia sp. SIMBA_061]
NSPQEIRDGEANEANRSRDGNRRAGKDDRSQQTDDGRRFPKAETRGHVVTERHNIELSPQECKQQYSG